MARVRNRSRRVNKYPKTLHCVCGKSYTRADFYSRHIQAHGHGSEYLAASQFMPDPIFDPCPFYCTCERGFTASYAFLRHLRTTGHLGDWARSKYQPKDHLQSVMAAVVESTDNIDTTRDAVQDNGHAARLTNIGNKDHDTRIENTVLLPVISSDGEDIKDGKNADDDEEATQHLLDEQSYFHTSNHEALRETPSGQVEDDNINIAASYDIPAPRSVIDTQISRKEDPDPDVMSHLISPEYPSIRYRNKHHVQRSHGLQLCERTEQRLRRIKHPLRHTLNVGINRARRLSHRIVKTVIKHKFKILAACTLGAVVAAASAGCFQCSDLSTATSNHEWLLDSTAPMHIATDSSLFSNLHPITKTCRIRGVGVVQSRHCDWTGVTSLDFEDGRNLLLENTLYRPRADVNIVSLRKLGEAGFEGNWDAQQLTIHNSTNYALVGCATRRGDRYWLDGLVQTKLSK